MKEMMLYSLLIMFSIINKLEAQSPLFVNSVVSNDIDFILDTDEDAFVELTFLERADKEMPDSQSNELFDQNTFVFEALFSNDVRIEIWCHSSFLTQEAAEEYAEKVCPRLGKLPSIQRDVLDHVVIHNGDATAFAETEGRFFILYSDNMDDRISTHDLEETVFHESVHASIQGMYQNDPTWLNAQISDPAFVTEYAQSLPDLEDMPETALFAYTLITHPGRLSPDIESWLMENIPNRIEFFRSIYPETMTTSSVEYDQDHLFESYPNPTNGFLYLSLEEIETNSSIKVYDIKGKLLKSFRANEGLNEINLQNLPNGVYFLSLAENKVRRIVKQ